MASIWQSCGQFRAEIWYLNMTSWHCLRDKSSMGSAILALYLYKISLHFDSAHVESTKILVLINMAPTCATSECKRILCKTCVRIVFLIIYTEPREKTILFNSSILNIFERVMHSSSRMLAGAVMKGKIGHPKFDIY